MVKSFVHMRITEEYLGVTCDDNEFVRGVLFSYGFAYCSGSDAFTNAAIDLENNIHYVSIYEGINKRCPLFFNYPPHQPLAIC